jgi:hypothetical protein
MTTYRCDNHVPEHIKSAVTSSQTVTGDYIELFGSMAVNVMAVCSNGAAGTLYIDGSNQLGSTAVWQTVVTQALTANQTACFVYSLTDQITSMHKLRCRFVSSAAGNVQVSINARRMTY